jgi:hypothetical protein
MMIPGAFDELWGLPLSEDREMAGALFGWLRDDTITIREVVPAVKKRTRFSCLIDTAAIYARVAEHRASGDGLVVCGTFHTEPTVGVGDPSQADLDHWRTFARVHGDPHFAGVTVRRPTKYFLGWKGSTVTARVFTKTPSGVIDHKAVEVTPNRHLL